MVVASVIAASLAAMTSSTHCTGRGVQGSVGLPSFLECPHLRLKRVGVVQVSPDPCLDLDCGVPLLHSGEGEHAVCNL